jgi:hypothetical protein
MVNIRKSLTDSTHFRNLVTYLSTPLPEELVPLCALFPGAKCKLLKAVVSFIDSVKSDVK